MDKIKDGWQKRRPGTRRLIQLYAALLCNANIKGFFSGKLYTGNAKALCTPGLNCYSCPAAVGSCPLGALQNALAASGHTAPWYILGILMLFGVLLGRTVCGWLCPVGLLQELLHRIPTPKLRKSRFTRLLSGLKYGVLAVFVLAVPLYFGLVSHLPLPAFCKYICPAGTLEGAVPLLGNESNSGLFAQLGILFTRKFVILVVILLACVFCYRAFCRFLCPLGAIYSLFSRFALTGMQVDSSRCNHCGACVRSCEMDVRSVSDRECISCGKCIGRCSQKAISLRCGKLVLQGSEISPEAGSAPSGAGRRRIMRVIRGILLAILIAAVLWFNVFDRTAETESPPPEPPVSADIRFGSQPGETLPDFSCVLSDGSVFRLSDTRGKIVFINQWATWCNPCVAELPFFERLAETYPDVVVLAFHHPLEISPKALPFIAENGWTDWKVRFTVDTPETDILGIIGGDNVMPRTVVLNRDGIVIYNETRSMTFETLTALTEEAGRPGTGPGTGE